MFLIIAIKISGGLWEATINKLSMKLPNAGNTINFKMMFWCFWAYLHNDKSIISRIYAIEQHHRNKNNKFYSLINGVSVEKSLGM